MLYSIELGDLVFLFSGLGFLARELALLDPGLLTRELTQVEYSGPADLTDLVQLDVLDERGLEGENPLNSDSTGNLADCEGPCGRSGASFLDDNTPEVLKPLFISLLDPISDGDSVTGLELGEGSNFLVSERLLNNFH